MTHTKIKKMNASRYENDAMETKSLRVRVTRLISALEGVILAVVFEDRLGLGLASAGGLSDCCPSDGGLSEAFSSLRGLLKASGDSVPADRLRVLRTSEDNPILEDAYFKSPLLIISRSWPGSGHHRSEKLEERNARNRSKEL